METGYCYQLKLVDLCGEEILIKEHCPVFLQINENQDQLTLNWKAYQGWDGVSEYEIYEILPNNERLKVQALPGLAHTYSLGTAPLEKSRHCYQIQAMESGNNCGITSFSNLACYEFEPRIFIPNAFTPNGDGQNDIWEIRGGFMRDFQIRIFNRWGKIVFESYSLTNSWDGTFGGRAVPEGVYVYQVRAWDEAGALIERGGSVAVIR